MNLLTDTHTHRQSPHAIVNLSSGQVMQHGLLYSAGIHPWEATDQLPGYITALAASPQVVAIGECGLDKTKGPAMSVQKTCFMKQAQLAESYGKPIIVHCVKAVDELIALKREIKPLQPWILHSFRGKPQQAEQLLREGFHLSFTRWFNPLSAQIVPVNRLLLETDDADGLTIEQVAEAVATCRGTTAEQILESASSNLARIVTYPAMYKINAQSQIKGEKTGI